MAENSKIEWCEHTANLWWGCTKVHAGCDNCYAETLSKRWNNDVWGNDKPRKMIKSTYNDLQKFQEDAAKYGEVHRVFVGSMMDIFEKPMKMIDSKGNAIGDEDTGTLRYSFFRRIDGGDYPNLMFLFLTKRPSNINKYIPEDWKKYPPDNVMFGTSPVDQETSDKLIPQLLQVKGKKFLSVEPQLDHVYLMDYLDELDWVICGGESGHGRRPFDLEWGRSLRDQCKEKDVPFFFKQIDKVRDKTEGIPIDLQVRQFPIF